MALRGEIRDANGVKKEIEKFESLSNSGSNLTVDCLEAERIVCLCIVS